MNTDFMKMAVELAKKSGKDIPIGAIIVKNDKIIASAVNTREKENDTTCHAEISVIRKANKKLKNWRLNDCELYVTLEPCPMCASAIIQARISKVYFGAYDLLNGAFCSNSDMRKIMKYNVDVKGGILEEECENILKNYFERLRKC